MVELQSLSLEELTGVVNMYPWFGGARLELCRRGVASGSVTKDSLIREALYIADRKKMYRLWKEAPASALEKPKVEGIIEPTRKVRAVGGDYFSQAQYDEARTGADKDLAKKVFAAVRDESPAEAKGDIAERFCTEALAEIFAEQGFTEEAKRIYSRLVLEFPEKSAYFAALIEKLEQNI